MEKFERARQQMVDTQLRTASITDSALLAAMGSVPRERFVPETRRPLAYVDVSHELNDKGRALATPATFARLVQLAEVTPNDVVLDVGCGSGYSTAVLANLASAVVALDNDPALVEKANDLLADLDIGNAAVLAGELSDGVASEAPFDVIVLEGAVDEVPPQLLKQLRDDGRLVAMAIEGATCTARIYVKTGNDIAMRRSYNAVMPALVPSKGRPEFAF